jgi:hypothetical protein
VHVRCKWYNWFSAEDLSLSCAFKIIGATKIVFHSLKSLVGQLKWIAVSGDELPHGHVHLPVPQVRLVLGDPQLHCVFSTGTQELASFPCHCDIVLFVWLTFLMLLLCLGYVAPLACTMWCIYGLNYATACACLYDTPMLASLIYLYATIRDLSLLVTNSHMKSALPTAHCGVASNAASVANANTFTIHA